MRYGNGHFSQYNKVAACFTAVIRVLPVAATSKLMFLKFLL
jgi:hypothetical protein